MPSSRVSAAEASQCQHRPDDAVEMIPNQEVAWKSRACEVLLVPIAVAALVLHQPPGRPGRRVGVLLARSDETDQRPRGLRRGRNAAPAPRKPDLPRLVRPAILSEATIPVLNRDKPGNGTADRGVHARKA